MSLGYVWRGGILSTWNRRAEVEQGVYKRRSCSKRVAFGFSACTCAPNSKRLPIHSLLSDLFSVYEYMRTFHANYEALLTRRPTHTFTLNPLRPARSESTMHPMWPWQTMGQS